jgi:zinc transporter ZupT
VLPFAESFLAWACSTAIPALAGLGLITAVGRWTSPRYVAAFALGIFFWFFVDTIQGSADLDLNAGFAGGVDQAAVVILFVAGILLFFWADRDIFSESERTPNRGLVIPLLAALAIGIHGFGEGTAFGSTAALTSSTSLFDAFGGVAAGAAYALHKMFEPMMAGALYVAYSRGHPGGAKTRTRDILSMALLFVVPSLVGATTGYFISYDATYFFALGTGTSIYVAFRLAKQALEATDAHGRRMSLKMSLALILGFILIYLAALLHS